MAELKIVALIGTPVHLNYFVNRIAQEHSLSLIIRENSRSNIIQKIFKKGVFKSAGIILNHLRKKKSISAIYSRIFGNEWKKIQTTAPLLTVDCINSPEAVRQLKEVQPDIVIVQGTTLIRNKTLEGIPLVLNLHWGLSPYYKGSYCTEWAILQRDVANIGYTVHQISAAIDGGAIITQGRPEVAADDCSTSLNMKLTRDGAAAMAAIIREIKKGASPDLVMQDPSKGALFLTKHWKAAQEKELKAIESKGILHTVPYSSKPRQPIIIWKKLKDAK